MIRLLKWAAFTAMLVGGLFGPARRWDLPWFWAYIGVFSGIVLIALFSINDPGLARERFRPGAGGIDRALRFVVAPLILLHYIIAALDVGRFHWSDRVPLPAQALALVGFALGIGTIFWSMAVNTFFSPVVRIQAERGHRLVTAGPYQFVRHPGYFGMTLAFACSGFALGSIWSAAPALGYVLLVLRRTGLEDRFLHQNLDGYAGYARKVRYKLLPGLW